MDIRRARGQAAVETVGIVTVVVLAMAATTVWLVGAVRAPDPPPDVIGHASRPLSFPDNLRYFALPAVPYGQEGADEPIGDALRGFGRDARSAAGAWSSGRREFSRAYYRRLLERGREALRDPLGSPALPDIDVLTPRGALERALRDSGELWDYIDRVRRLPRDQMALTIMRDSGTFAADTTVEVAQALLRRRVARGVRRPPAPERPAPGGDAPSP